MASPRISATDGKLPPLPSPNNENMSPRRSSIAMTMTRSATTTTTTTHIHTLPKTKYPTPLSSTPPTQSTSSKSPLSSHYSSSSDPPPPAYESSSSTSETDCEIENGSMSVHRQPNHATSSRSDSRVNKESRSRNNSSETPVSATILPTSSEEKKLEQHRTEWKWEVAVIGVEHTIFATLVGVVLGISGAVVSVIALLVVHVVPSFRVKPPPPVSLSHSGTVHRTGSSRTSPSLISTTVKFPLVSIFGPSKSKTPSLSSSTIVGDGSSFVKRVTFQLGETGSTSALESVYLPASLIEAASLARPPSPASPSASTSETLVNSPELPPLTISDSSGSGVSGQSSLLSPDGSVTSSQTAVSSISSPTSATTSTPPISFTKEKRLWRTGGKPSPSPNTSDAEGGKSSSHAPKRQMSIKIPGFKSLRRRSLPAGSTTASQEHLALAPADTASHENAVATRTSIESSSAGTLHCAQTKPRSRTFSFLSSSPTAEHPTTTTSPSSSSISSSCPFNSVSSSHHQPLAPRPRTNPYLPPFNAVPRTSSSTRRRQERQRVSSDASVPKSLSGNNGVAPSDVESSAGEEAFGAAVKKSRRTGSLDLPSHQSLSSSREVTTELAEKSGGMSALGIGRPSTTPTKQRVVSDSTLVVPSNHHNVTSPSPLRSIVVVETPSKPLTVAAINPHPHDTAVSSDKDSIHRHHKSPLTNLSSKVKRRFSLRNSDDSIKHMLTS